MKIEFIICRVTLIIAHKFINSDNAGDNKA